MEKQFGELSQFLTDKRDVELFRSSDWNNTAVYFTEVDDGKIKTAKAYFELLRFGLEGGDHQIYVRFPNTDYFVEMLHGGSGSAHGNMMIAEGKNVQDVYHTKGKFTIYSHDSNLLISFGDFPKFNFMTKVAEYDKGNPFNRPYPQESFLNYEQIKEALSLKFLKLPENIRYVEYMFKIKDAKKYFIVDCPAYNFKYTNQRFTIIENGIQRQEKIKGFQRYRDGGTTMITIIDKEGSEHKLFSPQKMFDDGKNLVPKFDDIELIEVSEEERENIIAHLGWDLEPKEEEIN